MKFHFQALHVIALLLVLSQKALFGVLANARILSSNRLSDFYSISVGKQGYAVAKKGVLDPQFNFSLAKMKEIIANPATRNATTVYNVTEGEQFVEFEIFSTTTVKYHYEIVVEAEPGALVRIVEHMEALWDHISASHEAYNRPAAKEKHNHQEFWIQFFCEKDGHFPITFTLFPKVERAYHYFATTSASDYITFTFVKTCQKGFKRDFLIQQRDLWRNPLREKPYHLKELLRDQMQHANLTLANSKNFIEIFVNGTPQIIVKPYLSPSNNDDFFELNLLGKGKRGGLVTEVDALEFILSIECKPKNITKDQNQDIRLVFFHFTPPPYNEVQIPIYVDCLNFVQGANYFPFNVGTTPRGRDVIFKGKTHENYSEKGTSSNHSIVTIPPEVGASEFYIFLDSLDNANSTDDFEIEWFDKFVVSIDNHILEPAIVNVPSAGIIVTKSGVKPVLFYNCTRTGIATLTLSLLQHGHSYDFTLKKECKINTPSKDSSGFWHFLFASGVIAFGCFLVTVLRALISKEHSTDKETVKRVSQIKEVEISLPEIITRTSSDDHYI